MAFSQALSHKGVRLIAGGWTFFIAENLVLSENRDMLVDSLGESGYRSVYGTLSTLACGSIAVGYFRFGRGQGPSLWYPFGAASQTAAFLVQTAGLVGFSQLMPPLQVPVTLTQTDDAPPYVHPPVGSEAAESTKSLAVPLGLKARCPIDFDHSRRKEGKDVSGMKRITRHPMLWSMAFCGLGSALGASLATEVCFGVFPTAMAMIGGAHQDIRHRRSGDLTEERDASTSLIPFAALLTGNQSWSELGDEMAWSNAGLATAIGAVLAIRRRRRVLVPSWPQR
jgi:uncharacterized membrane protein